MTVFIARCPQIYPDYRLALIVLYAKELVINTLINSGFNAKNASMNSGVPHFHYILDHRFLKYIQASQVISLKFNQPLHALIALVQDISTRRK
jgi:hypothetical protein